MQGHLLLQGHLLPQGHLLSSDALLTEEKPRKQHSDREAIKNQSTSSPSS